MNIALWVVQILLAIAFLFAGGMKTFMPIDNLASQMVWVADVPEFLVRFIGIAEIAGALGLVLPSLTRILPWLTPLSAVGLEIIMVLAIIFHLARGEFSDIISGIVLLVLVGFIAYGRWKLRPIAARSS